AAGPLEQAVTNKAAGFQGSEQQQRMFGFGHYDLAVNTLADHLARRDYVCGSRFNAADVYVGSAVMWGTQFGTLPKLDSFVAYADRLSQRAAYRRGKDEDNRLIAEMQAAG
ncbi:MAG TPA: glutathione S-transferase, partial [Sphingomicrobium sp.]|nr:glutathione S-transferase [Sphingomicrobium sp.]